jgi:hypothetical protein
VIVASKYATNDTWYYVQMVDVCVVKLTMTSWHISLQTAHDKSCSNNDSVHSVQEKLST